ncbi:MAG: RelA/SpoT domain-containing protein [Dehalococcoidales bacterium]
MGSKVLETAQALAYHSGMGWATRQYSYAEIDQAGKTLISRRSAPLDVLRAITIINNWRACHQFPLNTMQIRLRDKVKQIGSGQDVLVSQRIKRLPAIESKLRRLRNVTLVTMQDIGGCRAVVPSIESVYKLANIYKAGRIRHKLVRENDYIKNPGKDGYRSLHLIYEYSSDKKHPAHNGECIEIQLRSTLQHAWATTVEAVDAFASQLLKINQGNETWERFFVLMGCWIAIKEQTPPCPGAPSTKELLTEELRELSNRLNVVDRLSAIRVSVKHIKQVKGQEKAYYYLIDLDIDKKKLMVSTYRKDQAQEVSTKLAEKELEYRNQASHGIHKDILLASASSVSELERAYPNYYTDTVRFVQELREALK